MSILQFKKTTLYRKDITLKETAHSKSELSEHKVKTCALIGEVNSEKSQMEQKPMNGERSNN